MLFSYTPSRSTPPGAYVAPGNCFFLKTLPGLLAAVLLFCGSPAFGEDVHWIGGEGNWFAGTIGNLNWSTGSHPKYSNDNVFITNGGTAKITSNGSINDSYPAITVGGKPVTAGIGDTSTVILDSSGKLSGTSIRLGVFAGKTGVINVSDHSSLLANGSLYIGNTAGATGIVTLDSNSSISVGTELNIGHYGSGTLTLAGGSTASIPGYPFYATMYLARNPGSDGTLNILDSTFNYSTKTVHAATAANTSATICVQNNSTFTGGAMNLATAANTIGMLDINRSAVILSGSLNAGTGPGTADNPSEVAINITNGGSLNTQGNNAIGIGSYNHTEVFVDGGSLQFGANLALGGGANSEATLSLHNATIEGQNLYAGGSGSLPDVYVLGSGSAINLTGNYNTTNLMNTHFLFDSTDTGTSAINTSSTDANSINLDGDHIVSAWGMAYQNIENVFTLYTGQEDSFSGSFSLTQAPGMKIADNDASSGTLKVGFDTGELDTWDLNSQIRFTPGDTSHGWVYIIGKAEFGFAATYEFGIPVDRTMADTLVEYLESGLSGTGASVFISKIEGSQVVLELPSEFFAAGEYNIIGWGLSHFNAINETSVTLLNMTHVPEPSTWLMLLPGLVGVVYLHRRRNV